MANVTNISVLDSAANTATVSTLDAFRADVGTSSLTVTNATASLFNVTVTGTTIVSGTAVVSGTVTVANATASLLNATIIGTAAISGSLPAGVNVLGTATVLQGTNPWIVSGTSVISGSVAVSNATASLLNATITGTAVIAAGASQIGSVTAVLSGALPAGTNVIGTATVLQGTSPWVVSGTVTSNLSGSITATLSGSIPSGNNPIGKVGFNSTAAVLSSVVLNFSALGTSTIVTAVASQTTNVYRLFLTNTTATTLFFQDSATSLSGPLNLSTNGSIVFDLSGEPWFTSTSSSNFNIQITATSQISGRLYYLQA